MTTGATSFSVSTNAATLAAGSYLGTITVAAPGAAGSPQTVNVTLTVAAAAVPPGVSASPATLALSATAAAGAITIANTGGGALNWTASKTQPWLVLGATSGSGAAVLSVQALTGALPAGTYTDTVTISAPGAVPAAQTVTVTFTVAAQPGNTQPPLISINCGGAAFTGADGTPWSADRYFTGGDLLYSGYMIAGTQDLALYRSARRGLYGDFSYTIPVPNGSYILKLRFAETMFGSRGQRVFNVNVNGAPALTNFDILNDVPSLTADDKQFAVTVTNGAIQIDVIGLVGRGLLSGIQVFPAAGAPTITTFTAAGTTLSWTTANATTVTIDQGIGAVAASGSTTVTPAATTTYTLTASNATASVTRTATSPSRPLRPSPPSPPPEPPSPGPPQTPPP